MRRSLFLASLLIGCPKPSSPEAEQPSTTPGVPDVAQLEADVRELASDAYGGRGTLEPGGAKAADFISQRLASLGLVPAPGQDDYRVPYTLYGLPTDVQATRVVATTEQGEITLSAGSDLRVFGFSDTGTTEAEVVFVGYGITAEEYDWDDYAGVDVQGKVALMLRYEPGRDDPESIFGGEESTEHAMFTTKARNAFEHGAVGMILVTGPLHTSQAEDFRPGLGLRLAPPEAEDAQPTDDASAESEDKPFLAVHASQPGVSKLVSQAGGDLASWQSAIESGTPASELVLGPVTATLEVERSDAFQQYTDHNVLGVLPGKRADEWVVIGAHYDHLGTFAGEGDTTFNGADDNASGTTGVLALARALTQRQEPPERGIAFAFYSGEEHGLLGSKAMVADEILPADDIVFMLNLDMIGRNSDRTVDLMGDGYATGLGDTLLALNSSVGLDMALGGTSYAGNSDHDSYFRRDIPSMFFFTGLHEDYHRLSDHFEKLDYARMHDILTLAHGLVEKVASGALTPMFRHHVTWLGIVVEVVGDAAQVTEITEDSRAVAAGIQIGDTIGGFDGTALERPDLIGQAFRQIEPGQTVSLQMSRGDQARDVEVERAKTGYLGVYPQPPSAELRDAFALGQDEGVLLAQVLPEGPADKAGLQQGDVIYRLGGYPVGTEDLGRRLARIGAGEEVAVMVIRGEERLELTMVLGERPSRR
jgi:hypothetical protein